MLATRGAAVAHEREQLHERREDVQRLEPGNDHRHAWRAANGSKIAQPVIVAA
jgi:hypothetical protein